MNHIFKSLVFKILTYLPNKLGDLLYHALQKKLNKNKIIYKINSSKKSFESAMKILNDNNIQIYGKNLLELGSGWAPIIPYFFIYMGNIKKVITFDINKHYDFKTILKLNTYFENQLNITIPVNKNSNYNIPSTVVYYPNTNLTNETSFSDEKIDFIFSRYVLEHISPNDIYTMHDNFSKKIFKPFYILHMISPSDHRAYSDSKLSIYDFLKYSDEEWNKIQTKFDYHNRLRLPQYLEIFKKLNYEVVYLDYDNCDLNSDKYHKFKALKIHNDYLKFTEEELLAGSINILLKYKAA